MNTLRVISGVIFGISILGFFFATKAPSPKEPINLTLFFGYIFAIFFLAYHLATLKKKPSLLLIGLLLIGGMSFTAFTYEHYWHQLIEYAAD